MLFYCRVVLSGTLLVMLAFLVSSQDSNNEMMEKKQVARKLQKEKYEFLPLPKPKDMFNSEPEIWLDHFVNVFGYVVWAPIWIPIYVLINVINNIDPLINNILVEVLKFPKMFVKIITKITNKIDERIVKLMELVDKWIQKFKFWLKNTLKKIGVALNKLWKIIRVILDRLSERIKIWVEKIKKIIKILAKKIKKRIKILAKKVKTTVKKLMPSKWFHVYNKDCGGKNRICDKDGIYEWWGVPYYKFWAPKWKFLPWDDFKHNPLQVTDTAWKTPALSKKIPGYSYTVPPDAITPDFRLPEAPYLPKLHKGAKREMNRFYRISPASKFLTKPSTKKPSKLSKLIPKKDGLPTELGCYCVCVYKRLIPLSMGAVLTTRHILTTAMATDLILRRYKNKNLKTLNNILGAWYEAWHASHTNNNSYYMTPVRIHFHPEWNSPENTNRSHPLPNTLDLAVWTSHQTLWPPLVKKFFFKGKNSMPYICSRWTNRHAIKSFMLPPEVPKEMKTIQVGCQFVRDIGRKPYPWFKYMIQMNTGIRSPCPKSEWDWFLCIEMHGINGRLGADVGAALHLVDYGNRHGGLAGINSFSMKLRSLYFVNYYTVLDRHKVLNFLYDSYFGRIPPVFLDARFQDTQGSGSPAVVSHDIPWKYTEPFKSKNWDKYYTPIWY